MSNYETYEDEIEGYKIVIRSLKDGIDNMRDEIVRTNNRHQRMTNDYYALKKEVGAALPLARLIIAENYLQTERELFAIRNRRSWK